MAPSVAAADTAVGHSGGLAKQPHVTDKVAPVSTVFYLRHVADQVDALQAGEEMLVLNTIRCLAADLCQQVCYLTLSIKRT